MIALYIINQYSVDQVYAITMWLITLHFSLPRRNNGNGDRGPNCPPGNSRYYSHRSGSGCGVSMVPRLVVVMVVLQMILKRLVDIAPPLQNLKDDIVLNDTLISMINVNRVLLYEKSACCIVNERCKMIPHAHNRLSINHIEIMQMIS